MGICCAVCKDRSRDYNDRQCGMSIGTLICDSEATRFERRQKNAKNDNVVLMVQSTNVQCIFKLLNALNKLLQLGNIA